MNMLTDSDITTPQFLLLDTCCLFNELF